MSYPPIENHGVIGDLSTVALVGTDGSIDFMCLPQFDSPSVFAALLDDRRGGRFQVAPLLEGAREKQLYLPDTCVLLTRFLAARRRRRGVRLHAGRERERRGTRSCVAPRPSAARCASAWSASRDSTTRERPTRSSARQTACVSSPQARRRWPFDCAPRCRFARKPVRPWPSSRSGRTSLRGSSSSRCVPGKDTPSAAPDYVAEAFKETVDFWRRWVARSSYRGRWREMVNRSALTLKLLTSRAHGSIVASPTFGLPERLGGQRNWDYRYTWIRDASFTLYGLMRLGYTEEAAAFMRWVEARCEELEPDGSLQIMYGIDGRHELARGDRWRTSRATWARRRCASATPPTVTSSSTSTAS